MLEELPLKPTESSNVAFLEDERTPAWLSGLRRVESLESFSTVMKNNRCSLLVRHLSGGKLDQAIKDAQKADETRLVRGLCYVKYLYHGDTRQEAGDRVGISRSTTRRWARAWNQAGVEGLRPVFGGGRTPTLTTAQFDELFVPDDRQKGRVYGITEHGVEITTSG